MSDEMRERFRSLEMVSSRGSAKRLVTIMVIASVVLIVALAFVPWRQSVTAYGKVTAFTPMQRPQYVSAQIDGRLIEWTAKEGDHVVAGRLIGRLQDIKPEYLDPQQLQRYERQVGAYGDKQTAIASAIASLDAQYRHQDDVRQAAVASAEVQIEQAKRKLVAAEQSVISARQTDKTARLNLIRREALEENGIRSRRDLELARLDAVKAAADLTAANAQADVARNAIPIARLDRSRIEADASAKLQEIRAKQSELNDKLALIIADRAKLDVDIANLRGRTNQREIRASITGQLTRVVPYGSGQTVKAGETLATIVPENQDQAVELMVSDYDAPLLSVGRAVRLQFAGWPAIQFVGWPAASFGTFAGRIAVIDAVGDDESKRIRILVKPDPDAVRDNGDLHWPSPAQLRPGGAVRGWILLSRVPLGFELWRRFNGFPPTIDRSSDGSGAEMLEPKFPYMDRKAKK